MTRMRATARGAVLLSALMVAVAAFNAPERALPRVTVYKNAGCGCCNLWVAHLEARGFEVVIDSTNIVTEINERHGVTEELSSCHTALVGDYVVVGHVPVESVLRLLDERPAVVGIAVPGMPLGSPGMEMEGVEPESYSVLTFDEAGETTVFAEY